MKGIQKAVDFFVQQDAPYFMIVDAKNNCIGNNNKLADIDQAGERLNTLLSCLDTDSKAIYKIYCWSELPDNKLKGKVKDLTNGDNDICFEFSPYAPVAREENADSAYQKALWKVEREQKEREQAARLERIETLLLQRQIEEGAEDDDDVADQAEPKSVIGALMDNPQIQGALAGAVTAWLSKIMMPAGQPYAVAGLPGAEDDSNRIDGAIEILQQYDDKLPDHLEKLAAMAQQDTNKFKFLLTML